MVVGALLGRHIDADRCNKGYQLELGGSRLKKIFAAVVTAFAATAAMAQVDPNRVVATVNGEEIKGGEYYRRMEHLSGVGQVAGGSVIESPPGFLTVQELITERLVFQLAKQKGVMPTDSEVEQEYAYRKQDNPKIDEQWAVSGQTPEELRNTIRYEIAQFKIQTFGVTITNQEVDNYYKTHADQFKVPKSYQLRIIAVKSEADEKPVDTALASGTSFAEVAKKYSLDVTRAVGGEYGVIPETAFGSNVKSAIEGTKLNSATPWVMSGGDGAPIYVKFLVEDIKKERNIDLDDGVRRRIRRKMLLDKGVVKNDVKKEMKALLATAKIDIKQPEFADAYKKYVDLYLKEGAPAPAANGGN